jgi:acetyltransferase-like isoleucine patch superfamily enzyme
MSVSLKAVVGKISLAFSSLLREFIVGLPDEYSRFRVSYYNRHGCRIARHVSISPNVRLRGLVEIGEGSSLAQNVSIAGSSAGVYIGRNVMVAPNVVIVAFEHGSKDTTQPMVSQPNIEAAVRIDDDVWIAANVTISKGVTIGSGSIVGANSFVNCDVAPKTVVAGVPARIVRSR